MKASNCQVLKMCEVDNFYSRVNSLRDVYGRLMKPVEVSDADEQAEIEELERLRKEVARKRRREEIEELRRELMRAPCSVQL
jgi:uncharacterized protein YfkK (UPF0435 family)